MKPINTLAELKAERTRLRMRQSILENDIKNDVAELKESLNPLKIISKGAETIMINKDHGVVNQSIGALTDFLLKGVLFRNAGFIMRIILPFFAKNAASNYVSNHKTQILGWFGDLILRWGNKNTNHTERQPIYDSATANGHH